MPIAVCTVAAGCQQGAHLQPAVCAKLADNFFRGLCCTLQAEASKLLAELEQLRSATGDHAALTAENARLKGEQTASRHIDLCMCGRVVKVN